jgi:hypothetical protein
MSPRQQGGLWHALVENGMRELHHGDCIGADAEADAIARKLGLAIVVHPPTDPKKRAFCSQPGDRTHAPLPYLVRNHAIVEACNLLIAAPHTDREVLRSGTWATIRYARSLGVTVLILPR